MHPINSALSLRPSARVRLAATATLMLAVAAGAGPDPDRPVIVRAVADREAKQPHVAVGPDGRVYLVYGAGNEVRCVVSDDGGQTFGPPVVVGSPGVLALGMRRGPRIAVGAEAVVVTAIGGAVGKGQDGDLWAWRSTDGGGSWSEPVRLNTIEGSAREGLHAMSAGPDGRMFCAWINLSDDQAEPHGIRAEVRGVSSADGGATWTSDLLVHRSPSGSICPCCHPSASFGPDGALYVMVRDDVNGSRDMYLTRSIDGGRTFEPARKLGSGTWRLDRCPMDGGAIAAGPDAQVLTAWMRDSRLYSAEPGLPERSLGAGVQAWAAWSPSGPSFVWLAERPGRLLVQRPGDLDPIELARSAIDPTIAAPLDGPGPVIAAWEAGPGASGLFASRLDAASTPED